ncbi:hypothetical protein DSO57_1009881 [Entomophthora muscae]|uniref:Uncharacterized protein n=1 Tax=Entomophthora muscae TaxID=34485 RepID=A0ACC2T6W3_9FUNG|nr:hypothetical protein DSO57_1009881 [Entomophthora muscae]
MYLEGICKTNQIFKHAEKTYIDYNPFSQWDSQWDNHEASSFHLEAVAELLRSKCQKSHTRDQNFDIKHHIS